MARTKALPGPSRLSFILKNLQQTPKPVLNRVKSLSITLEARNKDFGARHFVKNDLPRLRYASQDVDMTVNKVMSKNIKEAPKAQMSLEFKDGTTKTLDIYNNRDSAGILDELMDVVAGERWRNAKAAQQ